MYTYCTDAVNSILNSLTEEIVPTSDAIVYITLEIGTRTLTDKTRLDIPKYNSTTIVKLVYSNDVVKAVYNEYKKNILKVKE